MVESGRHALFTERDPDGPLEGGLVAVENGYLDVAPDEEGALTVDDDSAEEENARPECVSPHCAHVHVEVMGRV